jgi:hypothetical protein
LDTPVKVVPLVVLRVSVSVRLAVVVVNCADVPVAVFDTLTKVAPCVEVVVVWMALVFVPTAVLVVTDCVPP